MIDPRKPDYSNTPASDRRPSYGYAPRDPAFAPVVSIVTPYYNGAASIFHETAQSVFRQSFQQWEWLIINDQATSESALQTLASFRSVDPRVRVIDHDVNKGLPAARNTGIAAARSEFIMLLDDDDLLEPTTIEKLYWHLQSYPEFAIANGWSVGFGSQEYLWSIGFERGEEFLKHNLATGRALIRKSVHAAVGGYDESLRTGLEDWEFWLRCASHGYWGSTVPEYLDWYRRRDHHGDRWADLDGGERFQRFCQRLREKYAAIFSGDFPRISHHPHTPYQPIRAQPPATNQLKKSAPRMLLIAPWLTMGGADKFNLDLLGQLVRRGWEVSIATTIAGDHSWMPDFADLTPDIFPLHTFLHPSDFPAFLRYLIDSRDIDVVVVSNSELGYRLLPYLRANCPRPAYIDYNHMEEQTWNHGGHPRSGVGSQDLLDLNIVASQHLRNWMVDRGADASMIEVAYINVDTDHWSPSPSLRTETRQRLELDDETTVLLYACRLCPQKRPRMFASVLQEIASRGLNFHALVAGDGEDRAQLEADIKAFDLSDRVTLLGAVRPAEMHGLMSAADIFFLPSLWEGVALSIYEAMAMQLPVVATDTGGQRELVTPGHGFLIPLTQPQQELVQYANALESLIRTPAQRTEIGRRARQRVSAHFRLDHMGDRCITLFTDAMKRAHATPRTSIPPRFASELAIHAMEWYRQSAQLESVAACLREAQRQRDEHAALVESLREELDGRQTAVAWLEQQMQAWVQTAKTAEETIADLRGWITKLEEGREWLDTQWRRWEATAAEREQLIVALQAKIAELESPATAHQPLKRSRR